MILENQKSNPLLYNQYKWPNLGFRILKDFLQILTFQGAKMKIKC